MPQRWYDIKAQAGAAEIYIYGNIGDRWDEDGVVASSLVKEIAALNADSIDLRINSFGGSVPDGLAIYNALKSHRAQVVGHIDGVALSCAGYIAMAADTLIMAANAQLMIHAPWTMAGGNAKDLRDTADMLDKYAQGMAHGYAAKAGISHDDALALLTDGVDHWYTAKEALAAGFVDQIGESLPVAASLAKSFDLSRFNPAASAAIPTQQEQTMPEANQPAAVAAVRSKEDNLQIAAMFKPFTDRAAVAALKDDILIDPSISVEQAQAKLLAKLGEDHEPMNPQGAVPRIEVQADAQDKFRTGVQAAVLHRMGMANDDRSNQFRGKSLTDLAAQSLEANGIRATGMTKSEIAGKVLAAHSTSDFPYLLADAANKVLQNAYESFPKTWNIWTGQGSVSDFKTINMIRMGAFNSLDTIPEGSEYTQGTIGEEREQLTPVTKGKFIQVTRQMLINDDLSGFTRLAQMLGAAAARTIDADVYGVLNTNGNMSDGVALFHATHGNLAGTNAAISVATLSAARAAMRKQTAPGSNATEYLNIMPRFLIVPVALEDHASAVVTSTDNTDDTGSRKRNVIRDWGPLQVVSSPVLDATSATAWYLAADAMVAPLVDVMFLDGNQSPYIAQEEEFLTDAIRWKVRLDYGFAANDYRGGYKNAGA